MSINIKGKMEEYRQRCMGENLATNSVYQTITEAGSFVTDLSVLLEENGFDTPEFFESDACSLLGDVGSGMIIRISSADSGPVQAALNPGIPAIFFVEDAAGIKALRVEFLKRANMAKWKSPLSGTRNSEKNHYKGKAGPLELILT